MENHINNIELLDYINGSLIDSDRQRVQRHLSECDRCQAMLADYQDTWQILGNWQPACSNKDLTSIVLDRIRSESTLTVRRPFIWGLDIRGLMRTAASVAAAILIGHLAGRWSLPPGNEAVNDDTIVQALYMDILTPGTATGWGQIILESETDSDSQG